MHVQSFPPVVSENACVLILGSMPGIKSLEKDEYYGHPQNAFWPIMHALFDFKIDTYEDRLKGVLSEKIALWDVLQGCYREGSLDSAIKDSSIALNDFDNFLSKHKEITHIFFNGKKSEKEFMKRVWPRISKSFSYIQCTGLPSTSPAMASLKRAEKIKEWQAVKEALI